MKVSSEPESRFAMLETIREYAGMQLRETGEAEVERLRLKHANYFAALARREVAQIWGAEPQVGLEQAGARL